MVNKTEKRNVSFLTRLQIYHLFFFNLNLILSILTIVCTKRQSVIASLICNTKQAVLGVSCGSVEVFKIHAKPASFFCQAMNLVQSKPKFTTQITKASFVVIPAKIEVNGTVQSFLNHCPPPSGCCLVTKNRKCIVIVRFNSVNTISS